MRTYIVTIAVNGSVHIPVEAEDPDAASAKAQQVFLDDFQRSVAQVGRKACSVENVEDVTGEG